MPFAPSLSALLPRLRRFAAALCVTSRERADEWVLRALKELSYDPPAPSEADWYFWARAHLIHLAEASPKIPRAPQAPLPPLEAALLDLPLGHRAALLLVTLEGCSYEEAARLCGISRAVFVSRLTSARHMLAHFLAERQQGMEQAPYLRLVKS